MAAHLERLATADALDLPLVEPASQLRRLGDEGPRRYLLVERSRYNGEVWATSHDTPADAAHAYASQECPEDFTPSLVDLDTGAHHYGALHVSWEPHPDSDPPAEPVDSNRTAEREGHADRVDPGYHFGPQGETRCDQCDAYAPESECPKCVDLAAVCEGGDLDNFEDVYVVDCQACGTIVDTYPEDKDGAARPFAEEAARHHNRTVHGVDR